jgi:hypothetical protein
MPGIEHTGRTHEAKALKKRLRAGSLDPAPAPVVSRPGPVRALAPATARGIGTLAEVLAAT